MWCPLCYLMAHSIQCRNVRYCQWPLHRHKSYERVRYEYNQFQLGFIQQRRPSKVLPRRPLARFQLGPRIPSEVPSNRRLEGSTRFFKLYLDSFFCTCTDTVIHPTPPLVELGRGPRWFGYHETEDVYCCTNRDFSLSTNPSGSQAFLSKRSFLRDF